MNAPRDLDSILAAWLEEGPTRLPDQTRRSITVALPTTSRAAARLRVPWRFPTMSTMPKLAVGAAAVIAVLLGGAFLLRPADSGNGLGACLRSVSPSPSPSPTPSPTGIDLTVAQLETAGAARHVELDTLRLEPIRLQHRPSCRLDRTTTPGPSVGIRQQMRRAARPPGSERRSFQRRVDVGVSAWSRRDPCG